MSIISITKFKGLELKTDEMVRDPSTASIAQNVMLYKGALVNFPYPVSEIVRPAEALNAVAQRYIRTGNAALVVWNGVNVRYEIYPGTFPAISIGDWTNFGVVYDIWDSGANLIQIGNWLYLCKRPGDWLYGQDSLTVYPGHMMKFRDIGAVGEPRWFAQLVGIEPPSEIYHGDIEGIVRGSNGVFDVAVAFREEYKDEYGDIKYLESRAISYGTEKTYVQDIVNVRIGIPQNFNPPSLYPPFVQLTANQALYAVIYTKLQGQAHYYYTRKVAITNNAVLAPTPPLTHYWVQVNFDDLVPSAEQDIEQVANLTGRGVPRSSYFITEFKGQVYYATRRSISYPHVIQVSEPLQSAEGIEANYIEDEFYVGNIDEEFTGLEVFLGQLVIFKENSTWVLTDSWGLGSIRPLFSDMGCISKLGSRGSIVIGDILYFINRNGVFAYNGQAAPVKISLAIQERLEKYDNFEIVYTRMGYFQKYNLLLITIVGGSTFVYHIDLQEWTELPDSRTLQYLPDTSAGIEGWLTQKKDELIGVRADSFQYYRTINDNKGANMSYGPTWESTLIDNGDIRRFKHLTFGRISMSPPSTTVSFSIIPVTGTAANYSINQTRDVLRIQRQLRNFTIRFSMNPSSAKPFMINGIEVEGHYRGRH